MRNIERFKKNWTIYTARSKKTEEQVFSAQFEDRLSLNDQEATYARVKSLQADIGKIKEELDFLELEASDSVEFIASLTKKLDALHESKMVVDELNSLQFEFCPACFAPIHGSEVEGACPLCKQASDQSHVKERALPKRSTAPGSGEKSSVIGKKISDWERRRSSTSGFPEF
ncbi:hypothetical protein [Rhodovulum sulfidophilum]|uniref:hypothetical protein n=1 Tax=Rhodovulum sulfidophilum TaxID=35806 RepID=UPI00138A0F73|nr:hypothetical protein [Rhodovulum sulfidophilum]NDK36862.1 hypothetical protein [Rhodovulum sulfidophilum]